MTIASETQALSALRTKLGELLAFHERGGGDALREARGWIDGYMSALIDSGVATSQELLEMVVAERRRRNGPGSMRWKPETSEQRPAIEQRGAVEKRPAEQRNAASG